MDLSPLLFVLMGAASVQCGILYHREHAREHITPAPHLSTGHALEHITPSPHHSSGYTHNGPYHFRTSAYSDNIRPQQVRNNLHSHQAAFGSALSTHLTPPIGFDPSFASHNRPFQHNTFDEFPAKIVTITNTFRIPFPHPARDHIGYPAKGYDSKNFYPGHFKRYQGGYSFNHGRAW